MALIAPPDLLKLAVLLIFSGKIIRRMSLWHLNSQTYQNKQSIIYASAFNNIEMLREILGKKLL